jgi:spore germination protein KC
MLQCIRFIMLLSLIPVVLTACWDMEPIDDTSIVNAVAIDKDKDQVRITLRILKVENQGSGGTSGQMSQSNALVFTETGPTIYEALRNITEKSGRRYFFQHNRVLIIGEEVAKEGIFPVIDFFLRRADNRTKVNVMVSRGQASGLMNVKPIQETLASDDIYKTHQHRYQLTAKTIDMTFHDASVMLSDKDKTLLLPIIEHETSESEYKFRMKGTAVFQKDKMIGTLNDAETQGYVMLRNLHQESILTTSPDGFPDSKVTFILQQLKSKIIPDEKDGNLSLQISIRADASIGEVNSPLPIKQLLHDGKLDDVLEKELAAIVQKTLVKSQKEMKYDYLGISEIVKRKKPKEWDRVKDRWNEVYPDLNITVSANATVRRTNAINNPISTLREEE